jgi:predicted esterase
MSITIEKTYLQLGSWRVGAMVFLPAADKPIAKSIALFTHGYTSHKGSLLTWPTRLAEEGMTSVIFDLPGHYLGTFCEVESFESFKNDSIKLFESAWGFAKEKFCEHFPLYENYFGENDFEVVLGGHSLGALMAIKALELESFKQFKRSAICVGLGMPEESKTHLFQTPFYKSTLVIREQLVSPEISPDKIFPWIKEEKRNCSVSNQKIHMICGKDDLVVGEGGVQRLVEVLETHGNQVSVDEPTKLPHHTPEAAAGHIKKYLKLQGLI